MKRLLQYLSYLKSCHSTRDRAARELRVLGALALNARSAKGIFALFFFTATAYAETPLLYSRTTLIIHLQKPAEGVNPSLAIDTEMRDAASIARTPGWFNFSSLEEYKGAMAVFASPTSVSIEHVNNFAPVDVLMIDSYGTAFQIMPKLNLAELPEPIQSTAPVTALLYLKSGSVSRFGIQPGDTVTHKMFHKKPEILTVAPTAPPPAGEAMSFPPKQAAPLLEVTESPLTPPGKAANENSVSPSSRNSPLIFDATRFSHSK